MRGCNKWQIWGMEILLLIGLCSEISVVVFGIGCVLGFPKLCFASFKAKCPIDQIPIVGLICELSLPRDGPTVVAFIWRCSTSCFDLWKCIQQRIVTLVLASYIWGLSQQGQTGTFWEKQYPSKKFKIAGKSCFWQQSLDHCCPPSPSLSRIWISGSIFLCWWWGLLTHPLLQICWPLELAVF